MSRIPPDLARPQVGVRGGPGTRRAAPRRGGGPGPLIVLAVVAFVPALVLYLVFSWSDDRVSAVDPVPPTPSTLVQPAPPPDPLPTDVLTFRRMPAVVSRGLNVDAFAAELAPFLATLNDRSCAAVSVDGQAVGATNPELAVIPASNQKLLVAAVALEVLGADHTFVTRVASASPPADGAVDGDLVLVGGGDPLLSSDWYLTSGLERRPVFDATSLDQLADGVVAAGVTRVTGDVVGDGARYDDEFYAPGWGTGVAGIESGPYDALLVNDARVLGEDQRATDPNAAAAREFARLLRDRGIEIVGSPVAATPELGDEPNVVASIESVPLTAVVAEMLTNSDNNTAELLVKEIGVASTSGAVGTREAGAAAITAQLERWGVDVGPIVVADGSGLSLDNRVTCDALLDVLQRFDVDGPLGAGLPVAAETGSLADAFVGHPLAGILRGKTGTLNNPPFNADPPAVKALAGYVPVEGGGAVEYALVLNGPTISDQSEYRPLWNSLADVLATYPSGPTPADLGLVR